MKKVKIEVSFTFECEVDAQEEGEAFQLAEDQAMEYLESTLQDARKFDDFWEYKVNTKNVSIA